MKGLIVGLIVAVAALVCVPDASAIPRGFRITPFRPNVGPVPRGVPARFFSPRFNNNFHFQRSFGYNLGVNHVGAAFVPSYGYGAPAAAIVPSYSYYQPPVVAAAPVVYQAPVAFAPACGVRASYAPAFAPSYGVGGCSALFGY